MGIYYKTLMQGGSVVIPTYNTYVGGVSASITSASILASTIGISVGNISNFTIVGSDIKCLITGSYALVNSAFLSNTSITYFNDAAGLVTSFSASSGQSKTFDGATSLLWVYFPNVLTISGLYAFRGAGYNATLIYIPRCTTLGTSVVGFQETFYTMYNCSIYIDPSMATINSGGVEGDLAWAITQGTKVKYVSNFTVPSGVTTLSAGTIYNTAIQLNFTPPSSTNAIDYYKIYNNGVLKTQKLYNSGEYINGLSPNVLHNFTIVAVDIYYNESVISNSISATTTNRGGRSASYKGRYILFFTSLHLCTYLQLRTFPNTSWSLWISTFLDRQKNQERSQNREHCVNHTSYV